MDYFGSSGSHYQVVWRRTVSILLGQWITLEGFGLFSVRCSLSVSILLGQWITLEDSLYVTGANGLHVSILLGQWITLEVLYKERATPLQ